MNPQESSPNLLEQPEQQLPVRSLHSPYFVLRTGIGGFYVDPQFNGNLVRKPVELLSKFLAGAQKVTDINGGEIRYEPKPNQRPLRYLHEGAIREFETAARKFCDGAASADQADLRKGFRLPDPAKEPDAYWVWGERFRPQLMVLWGCEREEHSSLPLIDGVKNVVTELRARAMTWMRLFREGIDLCKQGDPLADFLVFPVLNEQGKLTHIYRRLNGKYVTQEVKHRWFEYWKIRPLKAVPARSILEFQRKAEAFYRKAHPSNCHCERCHELNPAKPATGNRNELPALDYEQELRKGLRLPDPDLRPDAYLAAGPPFVGRILVMCPHPAVKDSEELAQQSERATVNGDRKVAEESARQLKEELATHNLHKHFFYLRSECLCLTEDKVLGLPAPCDLPQTGGTDVPPPVTKIETPNEPDESSPTVVAKLWKRRIKWRRLLLLWMGILGATLLAWLAFLLFAPNELRVASAEVTNNPVLDPDNQRNVILVQYNNRLGQGWYNSLFRAKNRSVALGRYSLRLQAKDCKLQRPSPFGGKAVSLLMDTGKPFEEGVTYQLTAETAMDVWGNKLNPATIPVTFVDKRPPGLLRIVPAVEDADNQLQLEFDEPLDRLSATTPADYLIPGMSVTSAGLQPDGQTVILKTDQPFESGAPYTICLKNIADASRGKNRMPDKTNEFTYAQVSLKLRSVSADEAQTHVKVVFNRRIDAQSAQADSTFRVEGMQIGGVTMVDDKSAELVFTNSFLTPNTPYLLHIAKLKDVAGKPITELSTNLEFQYTGPVDTAAAAIQDASLVHPNCLQLSFNKELRRETAEKEGNYGLLAAVTPGQYSEAPAIRYRPQLVSGKVVELNLSQNLPYGSYRLAYHGLEDLVGNSSGTNSYYEFRNQGLRYRTKQCSDTSVSPDRKRVSFKLQFRLDKSGADPRNFRFEAAELAQVTRTEFKPGANSTEVILTLDQPINPDRFMIRFANLKLEGDVSPQAGIVHPSQ